MLFGRSVRRTLISTMIVVLSYLEDGDEALESKVLKPTKSETKVDSITRDSEDDGQAVELGSGSLIITEKADDKWNYKNIFDQDFISENEKMRQTVGMRALRTRWIIYRTPVLFGKLRMRNLL